MYGNNGTHAGQSLREEGGVAKSESLSDADLPNCRWTDVAFTPDRTQ